MDKEYVKCSSIDFLKKHKVDIDILRKYKKKYDGKNRVRRVFDIDSMDYSADMVSLLKSWSFSVPFGCKVHNEYFVKGIKKARILKYVLMSRRDSWLQDSKDEFTKAYSEIIKKSKVKNGKLFVSNKIIDCMMSSDMTDGWSSCQGFAADEPRVLANLIYYMSGDNYVAWIENNEGMKLFRCWINKCKFNPTGNYSPDVYVFGRQYPHPKSCINMVRQKFMETIGVKDYGELQVSSPINNYIIKDYIAFNTYSTVNVSPVPYNDIKSSSHPIWLTAENKVLDIIKNYNNKSFRIKANLEGFGEEDLLCIYCGKKPGRINRFYGNASCGCNIYKYHCHACHRKFFENDELTEAEPGRWFCQKCYDRYYCDCVNCGRHIERDAGYIHEDKQYCPDCYRNIFYTCGICGSVNKASDINKKYDKEDLYLCNTCYESHHESLDKEFKKELNIGDKVVITRNTRIYERYSKNYMNCIYTITDIVTRNNDKTEYELSNNIWHNRGAIDKNRTVRIRKKKITMLGFKDGDNVECCGEKGIIEFDSDGRVWFRRNAGMRTYGSSIDYWINQGMKLINDEDTED